METKQLNNDKQLRLQELVKTSRDIYTRGIKTKKVKFFCNFLTGACV